MKNEGLNLICDDGEFDVIINLYNKWRNKNMYLNYIPLNDEEWKELVKYCKYMKYETAAFFLKMVDVYDAAYKRGEIGSPFVGFFLDVVSECFDDDVMFPHFSKNEYIPGNIIQEMYVSYVKWFLKGKPKYKNIYFISESLIGKRIKLRKKISKVNKDIAFVKSEEKRLDKVIAGIKEEIAINDRKIQELNESKYFDGKYEQLKERYNSSSMFGQLLGRNKILRKSLVNTNIELKNKKSKYQRELTELNKDIANTIEELKQMHNK